VSWKERFEPAEAARVAAFLLVLVDAAEVLESVSCWMRCEIPQPCRGPRANVFRRGVGRFFPQPDPALLL
jgi:hypothetical protein